MKVLYAIQGTGNGHLSRARSMIPRLQQHCDLDLLVSGTQSDVDLPYPVKYRYKGFSFLYNRKGGIHYGRSGLHNVRPRLLTEILRCPVQQYDLILNDFEPISAWAALLKGVPCKAFGHQASFLSEHTPRPARQSCFGEAVLRQYAPSSGALGFHFHRYDSFIHTPVIRDEIRALAPRNLGYYVVYLPAVNEQKLMEVLHRMWRVSWVVFSRYTLHSYQNKNVRVRPVDNDNFVKAFANCEGILTGAGFESPAEALYLGKKLFVIPIKGQYEQQCNSAALRQMGVPSADQFGPGLIDPLRTWVEDDAPQKVIYPDEIDAVVRLALKIPPDISSREQPIQEDSIRKSAKC